MSAGFLPPATVVSAMPLCLPYCYSFLRGILVMRKTSRRYRLVRLIALTTFVNVFSQGAMAQSQFSGAVGSATGTSAQGNIEAFHREMIDGIGIGVGAAASPQSLGPAAVGGGRARQTSHNGFSNVPALFPPATVTFGSDIREITTYGATSFSLAESVYGGRMRLGLFAGKTWMDVEARPNAQIALPLKGAIGSAEVDNTVLGASAIWSAGKGYVSVAGIYTTGTTVMTDKFVCCVGTKYREKHDGFTGSVVAGQVFALSGGDDGIRLDLRGSLGYTRTKGDPFDAANGAPVAFFDSFSFSTAWASFSPMLFTDVAMSGGRLRPYLQGTIKGLLDYSNRSQFSGPGVVDPGTKYDEARTLYSLEGGINANFGNWLLGASLYRELSSTARTTGGKLGVTYVFN